MENADESVILVSESWLAEMNEAIASLTANEAVKGVIITSGKKAFMAGADLKLLVEGYGRLTKDDALDFSQRATQMHRAIEQSGKPWVAVRSEEHTSELQSLMRIAYAVFCLKNKNKRRS